MDYFYPIISGILASLAATLVWVLAFSRFRPEIVVSDQIAESTDETGQIVYKIKIINKTRRAIMNIRAELNLSTPNIYPKGIVSTLKEIPLVYNERFAIDKFDLNDAKAQYAYRFLIYENLDQLWKDDISTYLTFRIYSTDSFSNLGQLHQKDYIVKRKSIVRGEFSFGNSMEIS